MPQRKASGCRRPLLFHQDLLPGHPPSLSAGWHQLGHAKARFSREAAANGLENTTETTDIYANRNLGQMIEVARQTG